MPEPTPETDRDEVAKNEPKLHHDEPADAAPEGEAELDAPATVRPKTPVSVIALAAAAIILMGLVLFVTNRPAASADKPGSNSAVAKEIEAQLQRQREENDRIRQSLNLGSDAGAKTLDPDQLAGRMRDDAAALTAIAKSAAGALQAKDAEILAARQQLADSQGAQRSLAEQLNTLRQDLSGAQHDNRNAGALQAQLDAATQKIGELGQQVQQLRQAPAELQARLNETTAQRDDFERQVRELRGKLARIHLFAGSEGEIQQEAQALYRALAALDGQAQTEIAKAYSQFAATLGASPVDRLAFASGSAALTPEELAKLQEQVANAPDNAFFFVVGYASKTGAPEDNRRLSSQRATAVADAIAGLLKPNQKVQAAYLGQTDRFGAAEMNQVCELWEIAGR